MNLKLIIYGILFMIFAVSCNKQLTEQDQLEPGTAELKAAGIGVTYYVAKNGSDNNPGTLASPFLTITKGVKVALAGNTVYVRAGTYHEEIVAYGANGTAEMPITIKSYTGEAVIIDGKGTLPASGDALVMIYSNYFNISGIEIKNARGHNLFISGTHCTASKINTNGAMGSGVFVRGDYSVVEDCQIWNNALSNFANPGAGINASGVSAARNPNYAILRRNVVYDNWGEGLSTFEATHTLIEDNVVYDNWSTNIYISDATDVLCQRNFVYRTKDMKLGSQIGILMGDEVLAPVSANNTIINNIVYGCKVNIQWWGSNGASGMKNFLIANNTFVNSTFYTNVWLINSRTINSSFKNNIIYQDISAGVTPVYVSTSNAEMHFSNNLWSSTPNKLAAGLNDIIGNANFANLKSPYLAASYALTSSSPGINAGVNIGLATDYLNKTRVGLPDMGANEYGSAVVAPVVVDPVVVPPVVVDPVVVPPVVVDPVVVPPVVAGVYYNAPISGSATKNDCGTGYIGSLVSVTMPAKYVSSTISQADADNKANLLFKNNIQAYANTNGKCTPVVVPPVVVATVYYNSPISGSATKNDCGTGYKGSLVSVTMPAKYVSSTISQADADNKARILFDNNIQAYANTNGKCTRIYTWK